MPTIEFTDNYEDLSTDRGYQFKFRCERCGNGYMSSHKSNSLGVVHGALETAGSILGGIFGKAARGAYEVQKAIGGRAHDQALEEAVKEIRPKFVQCRRCGNWTCRSICFNETANMCKNCAPRAEEEETAMRSAHVNTQVTNDLFEEENVRLSEKAKQVHESCGACGKPHLGKKFCPHCGKPTAAVITNCPKCGVKLPPNAKFCGDCGSSVLPKTE